jgi:hypothetical protein
MKRMNAIVAITKDAKWSTIAGPNVVDIVAGASERLRLIVETERRCF